MNNGGPANSRSNYAIYSHKEKSIIAKEIALNPPEDSEIKANQNANLNINGPPAGHIRWPTLWQNPVSELSQVGTTEDWQIVNLTNDTLQSIFISFSSYLLTAKSSEPPTTPGTPPFYVKPKKLPIKPYLQGKPIKPAGNEERLEGYNTNETWRSNDNKD
ncbi:hypothetical protein [Brevibacillus halotolerans]|uniref:hypothetical protein n=1 Tax=Brevibacillus halotolerans TaxID=1507437 RepID=UPI0015EF3B21|nr:hypothetical protein [Brevibacillus halotolerans]MBA4532953.1 hypothetical protein [Brevibacillus halotolerans]